MIVYHGSSHNFKQLKLGKSLVNRDSTMVNEGMGIYFSTFKDVAETYGKYLYTLEINDKYLLDFRKKDTCRKYIAGIQREILRATKVNIFNFINIDNLIMYMQSGGTAISGTGHEIYMLLDSTEKFYTRLTDSVRNKIYSILKNYDKKHLYAYLFTYSIRGCGVIKNVSPEIVRIVNKECNGQAWGNIV